jgi:hypothetical protein
MGDLTEPHLPVTNRCSKYGLTASRRRSITPGRLAWGSGPPGGKPDYTGLDVLIVRGDKIAALYVFLDSMPS